MDKSEQEKEIQSLRFSLIEKESDYIKEKEQRDQTIAAKEFQLSELSQKNQDL